MTDKEFETLINEVRLSGIIFYGLLSKAEREYKERFGHDASDVDDSLWIKAVRACEESATFEELMQGAAQSNSQRFGAYIDENGNCYIGEKDNIVWLYYENPEKYTRVYNEKGGDNVSKEDILCARSKHPISGGTLYFDSGVTKELFWASKSLE